MKAEIIAVGTELLLGQIANTNAQYISQKLADEGIGVYYHTVVGDNPSRLLQVIQQAEERANLIIFTGGLGPTKDDLTKETIAQALGMELVIDLPAKEQIETYFKNRNIPMTPNNIRQAMVLSGAHVFPNHHGLAPGMGIVVKDITYILLPGPPSEMIPMFNHYVIPYLRSQKGVQTTISSRVLRFFGIGESRLVTELEDLIENQDDPTIAPYAKEAEVTLRITTLVSSPEEAKAKLDPVVAEISRRVGNFLYGEGEENSLEAVVLETLKIKNLTFACAESCTGGWLSHLLTSISGTSAVFKGSVVSYSNEAKKNLLHIAQELLEKHGAISPEAACQMAKGVRQVLQADVGLSITGVAGPETSEGKAVGSVIIGISTEDNTIYKEYRFAGSRQAIQLRAAKAALFELLQHVKKGDRS